jgi:hypothetical protein
MSFRRTLTFFFAVALSCASPQAVQAVPVAAGATADPHFDVRISPQAFEGPRGTILASLRAVCDPGLVVDELRVQFSQGDVITPSELVSPIECDGEWHRKRLTSLEAFEPGPATLTALLSVWNASTGEPEGDVFVEQQIFVRPAARIWLPKYAELKRYGGVALTVWARCDRPWVLSDFLVSGLQGGRAAQASLDTPCDGTVRAFPVRLRSSAGPFTRGAMQVDGALSLLDPEFFDPVTTATATRTVWVR